jgi:hypothetical protein
MCFIMKCMMEILLLPSNSAELSKEVKSANMIYKGMYYMARIFKYISMCTTFVCTTLEVA